MIKFIKYFITGAIAAAIDFALFAALVKLLLLPWYIAAAISFVAATIVNYLLSVRHVFQSGVRFKMQQEIALTFLVSLVGLVVNQAILFFLIRASTALLLAKVGATGAVFVWNYAARHYFVFRETPPQIIK